MVDVGDTFDPASAATASVDERFPESHAASFALLAYASAYLKHHYLAAFTTAMLNNQPMGFYHPVTLVKDAQGHGLHFKPVDLTPHEIEPPGSPGLSCNRDAGIRRTHCGGLFTSGDECG